jgi:glycosyltransferase involved in cell wall biosynthesis
MSPAAKTQALPALNDGQTVRHEGSERHSHSLDSIEGQRPHIWIPMLSARWHGGARVLLQLANYCVSQGHLVTILCPGGHFTSNYELDSRVTVRNLGIRSGWKIVDYASFLVSVPFALPREGTAVANFFVTYFPVRLAALIKRTPYIYFVQDIECKYAGVGGWILNQVCKSTYADKHIIAANPHLGDRLAREFGRRCESIQVGPAEIFYQRPVTRPKEFDIIYFLRRESWKGLDRFRKFVALCGRRVSILCVSQDDALLSDMRREGTLACRKPADDEELIDCIDSARLLLYTSYKEGFALPPLEAMARGVPSIMYPCGGPDIYARHGVNSLYVQDEPEAVETVLRVLESRSIYQSLSAEGRATAAQYRMKAGLERLLACLAQAAVR